MVIISDNCIAVKLLCGTITQNAPCPAGLIKTDQTRPAGGFRLLLNYFRPYFLLNLSTRPLVSTSFCLPV